MDVKKMIVKNSQNNMTGLLLLTFLAMGFFFGSFFFVSSNASSAGVVFDSKYNDTFNDLNESKAGIDAEVKKIQQAGEAMTEPDNTWVAQLMNGIKGLGSTFLLLWELPGFFLSGLQALLIMIIFTPTWALGLIVGGITIFIVFLILRVIKGETAL